MTSFEPGGAVEAVDVLRQDDDAGPLPLERRDRLVRAVGPRPAAGPLDGAEVLPGPLGTPRERLAGEEDLDREAFLGRVGLVQPADAAVRREAGVRGDPRAGDEEDRPRPAPGSARPPRRWRAGIGGRRAGHGGASRRSAGLEPTGSTRRFSTGRIIVDTATRSVIGPEAIMANTGQRRHKRYEVQGRPRGAALPDAGEGAEPERLRPRARDARASPARDGPTPSVSRATTTPSTSPGRFAGATSRARGRQAAASRRRSTRLVSPSRTSSRRRRRGCSGSSSTTSSSRRTSGSRGAFARRSSAPPSSRRATSSRSSS